MSTDGVVLLLGRIAVLHTYRVATPPGKSWKVLDFSLNFPGPGRSWKMSLVLKIEV